MTKMTRALALGLLLTVAGCDPTGPEPAVEITAVSPALLTPGVTVTITGSGFSSTPANNTVTIGGATVPVLTASGTELTVELSEAGFPCAAGGEATVTVTVGQRSASIDHPIEGPQPQAVAVGEKLVMYDGPRCVELTEAGRYVISVFNTNTQASATTAFRLRGTDATVAAATVAADASRVGADVGQPGAARSRTDLRLPDLDDAAHARMLQRNIELAARLGPSGVARSELGTRSLTTTAAVPGVGDTQTFRIPDLDATSLCTSYEEVTGRVVYSGSKGVIFEDVNAPLAGQMDARWAEVGQEFDDIMYPVLLTNFGDPLIKDAQLDDNGRLFMLFSEVVNNFEGNTAGFVFSGDLFQRSQCASSDVAEIFYGMVPTSSGTGFSGNTAARWQWTMRSTVIHEVKHITSFATRDVNGQPFEQTWLEEATARMAEELYAREVFGYGQNDNTDYPESIYCEVRPTASQCAGLPYVMAKHYDGIADYYGSMETLTPIGRVDDDDFSFYGSGWLFVRWAIDNSGEDESAFLRQLTSSSLTGVSNLAARTGRSFSEMLADFSLATLLDDRTGFAARPWLSFASWDTRGIFAGLHDDFAQQGFPTPFPLSPRIITYGDFDVEVPTLRSGTASLFELSGTMQGSQTVQLIGNDGGAPPAGLGLALVRIQ